MSTSTEDILDVVAIVTPKEGKWEKCMDVLSELGNNVKKHEPGALSYQIFQDRTGGEGIVILEKYKDHASFKAHHESEHFQKAGQKMGEEWLLAKPLEIKVLGYLTGFSSR